MSEELFQRFLSQMRELSNEFGGFLDSYLLVVKSREKNMLTVKSGGTEPETRHLLMTVAASVILDLESKGYSEEAAFRSFLGELQDSVTFRRKERQLRGRP